MDVPTERLFLDRPLDDHERLLTEAAQVEDANPALAADLLALAALAANGSGWFGEAVATARRGYELQRTPNTELALGVSLIWAGEPGGEPLLEAALGRDDIALVAQQALASMLIWTEQYDVARSVLDRAVAAARRRDLYVLPGLLDALAALDYRTGRWAAAASRSTEALRVARSLEQREQIGSCLTTLARLAAARGEEDRCRTFVAEALDLGPDEDLLFAYGVSALGLLELGCGRPEQAVAQLERLFHAGVVFGEPMVVRWLPDLVEAYSRAQRGKDSAEPLATFERQVGDRPRKWGRAALARCHGLLAQGRDFDVHFAEALEWHAQTPDKFERARTELCYGERLRRARRGREAKAHLQSALGTFERLGAGPWAARARRELGSPRRSGAEALTAHEREVVALVGRGATNKEAAAALFVSPKTIEYHLAGAYRKLDVRSRTELAIALREGRVP